MTVRLYQSDDVGAPALGLTNDGSLITILRACLVEGYGSRTPQGWLMPFSDLPNKIACFKPSGVGDTIRVDDSLDYRYAACKGFAAMSDLNTGTEEYPRDSALSNPAAQSYRQWKRGDTGSGKNSWMVIAGDDWFYYINHDAGHSYPAGFYFGKYDCVNSSFEHNYIINGKDSISVAVSFADDGLYNHLVSKSWYTRRNYQGSESPVNLSHRWTSTPAKQPNPFTGSLEFNDSELTDGNSPYVRYGKLMNNTRLKGDNRAGYSGGDRFTQGLKKYVMYVNTTSCFALEYDEDDG